VNSVEPTHSDTPRLPVGINGSRLDLVEEFRSSPFGRHSPDLQALLDHMRGRTIFGKHFLLMIEPHSKWMLAKFSEALPLKTECLPDHVFESIESAEKFVFDLRWADLFGQEPSRTKR